jgi:hypothetical protein
MLIDINPSDGLRRLGYLVVLACTTLPLLAPLTLPWRCLLALSILLVGVVSWHMFLRRCPDALIEGPDGRLALLTRAGQRFPVSGVDRGIVRPWLVSAVLRTSAGRVNLFVPGWMLPPQAHWRLRRALIGFRPSGRVI